MNDFEEVLKEDKGFRFLLTGGPNAEQESQEIEKDDDDFD